MSAQELREIGLRHKSDKWHGHNYAEAYSRHFSGRRDQELTLLEIGIGGYDNPDAGGESLRCWKDYLPNAQIVGLDFYNKKSLEEERIAIFQGSQADPCAIATMLSAYPGGFDVIIDDGSHRPEHIISTLYMLWASLRMHGYYVIEDLQTSYWPNHGGKLFDRLSSQNTMTLLRELVDGLNWQEMHQPGYQPSQFDLTVFSCNFYHNIAFIEKGLNTEGSTEVFDNRVRGVSQ